MQFIVMCDLTLDSNSIEQKEKEHAFYNKN